MHPVVRKAVRITLAALALFSVAIGVLDIANGVELIREVGGRVRPSIAIVNIVFGLLLLGFTIPRVWWSEPKG